MSFNRLFIAEKPNLGRAIAEGLGKVTKCTGYFTVGNDVVTWCFGHMLELFSPEDYNKDHAQWKKTHLPIIPSEFKLAPNKDFKTKKPHKVDQGVLAQLKIIGELLKKCKVVVNAGDPDREGQLIIDEVLDYLRYTGPAQRIWLASLDGKSVANALASLKDNASYRPLKNAALARSRIDWLGGMNLSRAMTLFGRDRGMTGVLSMGRVQTPTLGLVVDRDREIENFKPVDYAVLQAAIKHQAGNFAATLVLAAGMPGTDPEGRLVDMRIAQALANASKDKEGKITFVERKEGKQSPPKPYALSSLQKEAGAKFGMSAQAVLDTAQSLYDKKMTSYPRTDCEFLPEEQFPDAPGIIGRLASVPEFADMAKGADFKIKSSVWNTAKVTAHHAIIPTGESGSMTEAEKNCYFLIVRNYILQFWPPEIFETQKILLVLDGKTQWEATGRVVISLGYRRFMDREAKDTPLPKVEKGDTCQSGEVEVLQKRTEPPSRFTEGTLIEAMKSVHKYVADPAARAKLKETSGIGTEATRAAVLETLKKRGYLTQKGKSLISTDVGRAVVDLSPASMRDVATTAALEERLSEIADGKASHDQVVAEYAATLDPMIEKLWGSSGAALPAADCEPCPKCGKPALRKKGKYGVYWSCSAYPECNYTGPDERGKPGAPREKLQAKGEFFCPECKEPLKYGPTKKGGTIFWCGNDKKHSTKKVRFFEDNNGEPVLAA